MKHFSRTSIQFIAGFTAAFLVSSLPLSAAIAPLKHVTVAPVILKVDIPKPTNVYEVQTTQIRGQLDLERLARLEAQFGTQIIATENYIPTSLDEGDSEDKVALKILEKSAETWINDTTISRTITAVNDGLSANVGDNSSFKFRVKPLTGETEIVHYGEVKTSLGYDVSDKDVLLQVSWSF